MAVPLNVPDNDVAAKFVVVILDAEIFVALKLPENVFAVITLPAKLPLPSLSTKVLITLFSVANVVKFTEVWISETPKEPNLITLGASAVPPKSPANLIFPFAVVVASGNAFWIALWSLKRFLTYAVVATAVLLSVDVIVPAYTVLPKLTIPENVGATNDALLFNAVWVADEITLSKSAIFSTFDNPKFALAFVAFTAPVPPFTTATIPVTFVAVPLNVPTKEFAKTLVAAIFVALTAPENVFAVITLPAKLPLPSLFTKVLITLSCVAAVVKFTEVWILETPKEPNLITLGASAVPPKSPANLIFPLAVVVASGKAFCIVLWSLTMFLTKAVVATAVLLSVIDKVPAFTVLPRLTIPENVGAINDALLFNAVSVAVEITLSKSAVFSTFDKPKFALALVALVAPVPPFAIATIPDIFVAVPLNVPDKVEAETLKAFTPPT